MDDISSNNVNKSWWQKEKLDLEYNDVVDELVPRHIEQGIWEDLVNAFLLNTIEWAVCSRAKMDTNQHELIVQFQTELCTLF